LSAQIPPASVSILALKARAAEARIWLFEAALPLWWETGFDRATACFFESLDASAHPLAGPRRVRAQARQAFVYAAAGRLGWDGPWREAAGAGADVLLQHGLRADGGSAHMLGDDGRVRDSRRDLYDAAFIIFALAHAGRALDRDDLLAAAHALSDWTFAHWAHPLGGLYEGERAPAPPRRQNPHMHMLEAQLALHEATGAAECLQRASAIVALMRAHWISPRWGALLEFFNEDWSPRAGDEGCIVEPGHQFEWVWLLDRYHRLGGEDIAGIAARLHAFGETHGLDSAGYAIDEVWADGGARTPSARLWPQTERLKANLVRFEATQSPAAAAAAAAACQALQTYLFPQGHWRDRRHGDGGFKPEPAPASSFYHIMLAYMELIRVADQLS